MLQSVTVNFSETGSFDLEVKGITLFVGPNNSGKSLLLREIETIASTDTPPNNLKIITNFDIEWPDATTLDKLIEAARANTPSGVPSGHVEFKRLNPNGRRDAENTPIEHLKNFVSQKTQKGWVTKYLIRWGVIRLDGRSRFNLTNDQQGGDLEKPPQNVLANLFQDEVARASVRALVKDAFNVNLYVDPTNLGQLRIKLADGEIPTDEQSLNAVAREFYRGATHIKDASDGVQAFTGIVAAILSGEYHTILIDEPEAFLHPPLARKLGKSLATIASERNGALMASTHSPDFLMGCLQASQSVKVVRLEYSQGKSRAKSIDPESLKTFLNRPLMRSANVISGLFHDGVIVTESDNDRAFYSEIFNRLADGKPDYPSILFINAQNKQTIQEIIGPLREFGVPAAAITDIDIVKDGGNTWTNWLKAVKLPKASYTSFGQQRSSVNNALQSTGRNMKIDGGLELLDKDDRLAADMFFDSLESFGVFPVRRGEVENWLPHLNVPGKKTDWTVAMLERLGSDTNDMSYIRPTEDDVWAFLEKIVAWIKNSARKGME
ncbi:ATP-dependent nuclease [Acetobacter sp.]|jgi:predicted ATPase|uniref:ATP-dependent nuclease n=1 Tax=Acetobacter sp. TaxID=440 RepID=UPI0025C1BC77|nr:ATP-binding protein [Acetobacter sp.]MCH4090606.1 ATP-binding protein [Acetobacter sp.]MCI1300049.1 ATP-binding protein [Acetobacter sp.]MCI1316467.1 ATP-binding protein [Acetobacter sp.]